MFINSILKRVLPQHGLTMCFEERFKSDSDSLENNTLDYLIKNAEGTQIWGAVEAKRVKIPVEDAFAQTLSQLKLLAEDERALSPLVGVITSGLRWSFVLFEKNKPVRVSEEQFSTHTRDGLLDVVVMLGHLMKRKFPGS